MNISKEQRVEMLKLSLPLMEWLRANAHPHVYAIVEGNHIELVEGVATGSIPEITVLDEADPERWPDTVWMRNTGTPPEIPFGYVLASVILVDGTELRQSEHGENVFPQHKLDWSLTVSSGDPFDPIVAYSIKRKAEFHVSQKSRVVGTSASAHFSGITANQLWFPNPLHAPEIPKGWELHAARLGNGNVIAAEKINSWTITDAECRITEYCIRRKPSVDAKPSPELVWLASPGKCPTIPEGYEFAGVELVSGRQFVDKASNKIDAWTWGFLGGGTISRYAIRQCIPTPAQEVARMNAEHAIQDAVVKHLTKNYDRWVHFDELLSVTGSSHDVLSKMVEREILECDYTHYRPCSPDMDGALVEVWIQNPGFTPKIPDGWELFGVRRENGEEHIRPSTGQYSVKNFEWGPHLDRKYDITHYAIRKYPKVHWVERTSPQPVVLPATQELCSVRHRDGRSHGVSRGFNRWDHITHYAYRDVPPTALRWILNTGKAPSIPAGWVLKAVRFRTGAVYVLKTPAGLNWSLELNATAITCYLIRKV